jgi:hypothetical protein
MTIKKINPTSVLGFSRLKDTLYELLGIIYRESLAI